VCKSNRTKAEAVSSHANKRVKEVETVLLSNYKDRASW